MSLFQERSQKQKSLIDPRRLIITHRFRVDSVTKLKSWFQDDKNKQLSRFAQLFQDCKTVYID